MTQQPPTLTSKVVKGAGWVFAKKAATRSLALIQILVLARLLTPQDFGLFGLATLAIATLETLSQTGFNKAIIQHSGDTHVMLDTAWTVQMVRGIGLAILLFALAPTLGWFFSEPRSVLLLQAMAISVFIRAFVNIGVIYFPKEMDFRKAFVYDMSVGVSGFTVGVLFAYILRSPWALVWGSITSAAMQLTLSFIVHPYRPKLNFNMAHALELFRFGRWVFTSSLMVFIITHGDDAFIGKMLGAGALGLYQMAYRISSFAATEIVHTISEITFPAYSKLQRDIIRLRQAYFKVLPLTMLVAVPIALGTAAIAPMFFATVLGEKWAAGVLPTQILCLFGLSRAYGSSMGPVLYGSGNPKELTKGAFIEVVLMAAALYPLTLLYGMIGTCIAVVAPSFASQIYLTFSVSRILHVSPRRMAGHILRPVISAAGMFVIVYSAEKFLANSLISLTMLIALGALTYTGLLHLTAVLTGTTGIHTMGRDLFNAIVPLLRKTSDPG